MLHHGCYRCYFKEKDQIIPDNNWERKKKISEQPAVSREKRTGSFTGGTPPSPMFTRFVGGITTLSSQGLSQSREMLLDRVRKAGGDFVLSDVKAAITKYDESKELEPFARFFRDMDQVYLYTSHSCLRYYCSLFV